MFILYFILHTHTHTRTWCNGFCRWKWTGRPEFKSWTRLFAVHIQIIHYRKIWICCGDVIKYVAPSICGRSGGIKMYTIKRRRQKNIHNKPIQTKIHLYINKSSSSCRAISTDIPGPFSPPFSIVHCFWQVFKATSCISIELLYVGSSWSSSLCSSMWRGP